MTLSPESVAAAPNEVIAQHMRCQNLARADIDHLIGLGCHVTSIASPLVLVKARVQWQGRYSFEFDDEGEVAIVIPAFEDGDLLDLVAWCPKSGHLATWLGRVNALGWCELYSPNLTGEPLNVWASPLGWLKAGRRGMVPINIDAWAQSLRFRGDHVAAFLCEDPNHGRSIRAAFNRPQPRVFASKIAEAA